MKKYKWIYRQTNTLQEGDIFKFTQEDNSLEDDDNESFVADAIEGSECVVKGIDDFNVRQIEFGWGVKQEDIWPPVKQSFSIDHVPYVWVKEEDKGKNVKKEQKERINKYTPSRFYEVSFFEHKTSSYVTVVEWSKISEEDIEIGGDTHGVYIPNNAWSVRDAVREVGLSYIDDKKPRLLRKHPDNTHYSLNQALACVSEVIKDMSRIIEDYLIEEGYDE